MPGAPGGVPERPKGTGCKPVGSAYGGSNPPAPTKGEDANRSSALCGRTGSVALVSHGNAPGEVAHAFHRALPVEFAQVDLRRRDRAVPHQLLERLDVAGMALEVEDSERGT